MRWTSDLGVVSLIGALICCNDETGVLMADRGWSMNDRPFGLFERERIPDQTQRIFRAPVPGRTGMFDEIDGIVGWYAGATWQLPGIVKLQIHCHRAELAFDLGCFEDRLDGRPGDVRQ